MSLASAPFRPLIDGPSIFYALPVWEGYPGMIWLEAQVMQESGGNPQATHMDKPDWLDTSWGLFQIEGRTAQALLPGLLDPAPLLRPLLNTSLAFSIHLANLQQYGAVDKALAAYNGGIWGASYDPTGRLDDQRYVDSVLSWCARVRADRGV